jgi:hypothetical protein
MTADLPDRQLAVYDFAIQPALGDFYLFLQASLSLCAELGIDDVDLCVVADPSRTRNPVFRPLMEDGALRAKVFELLPMTQLHPKIRNIFVVERLDLAVELARRTERPYKSCWPPCEMLLSDSLAGGQYIYYANLAQLDRLHRGCEVMPRLRARPKVAAWAREFLAAHGRGGVPITVNLRSNPAHGTHRNMVAGAWRAFFDHASSTHRATFFLLGAADEDFSLFRSCDNVVITKDWYTTTEQDLALIEHAQAHLGCASGPSIFPVFVGDKPALIVNCDAVGDLHTYRGSFFLEGDYLRFSFGSPNYRVTATPETEASLKGEFAAIMGVLAARSAREQSEAMKLDAACAKGMDLHREGHLDLAGQLYRAVLTAAPQHPGANYGLGMLHVQMQRANEGLPFLKAALLAQLEVPEYWLGYLEVLMQVGRHEAARNILALGLQQGLSGAAIEEFAMRLQVPLPLTAAP